MVQTAAGMKDVQWPLILRKKGSAFRKAHHRTQGYQRSPRNFCTHLVHSRMGGGIALAKAIMISEAFALFQLIFIMDSSFRDAQALNRCNIIRSMVEA